LGRGKKAASFRFRLTATKKRPPWICAFAEGFLYVFFEVGRLQAAFAFADSFLLSTGFFWDVVRQESISKTPGAKSSFTFFEALPKPSQNESFCKCHPRSHGTVQRCGQQNLAALSQMHSRQFSWNLACLVHGLLAFVLGRECMRIASWYLGLVGLYSCSMSKHAQRTKRSSNLFEVRGRSWGHFEFAQRKVSAWFWTEIKLWRQAKHLRLQRLPKNPLFVKYFLQRASVQRDMVE
jgi:hypothetical protein